MRIQTHMMNGDLFLKLPSECFCYIHNSGINIIMYLYVYTLSTLSTACTCTRFHCRHALSAAMYLDLHTTEHRHAS